MPWPVIVMVSGVTMLIALPEKTQRLSLFADLLHFGTTRLGPLHDGSRGRWLLLVFRLNAVL
jgi:hypothetical protein